MQNMTSVKNYGFVPDKIEVEKDYVFGSYGNLGGTEWQPDGQWIAYTPVGESQLNFGFDPQGCVSFGTLNCVETLLRRMFDITENFSDRYLAKVSNTTPQGNSPQKVAEALRKSGTPKERDWPITPDLTDWDAFYGSIPFVVQNKAKEFVKLFGFKHEYVKTTPTELKQALKYSPLGISVSAWRKNDQGLYISEFPNNHWVELIGYKDKEYWIVYDSYFADGVFYKKLAWDHEFSQAKRYAVNLEDQAAQVNWLISFFLKLPALFRNWYERIAA